MFNLLKAKQATEQVVNGITIKYVPFFFFFFRQKGKNQFSFGLVTILYLNRMLHIHFIYHLKSDNQEVIMWPALGSYSIRA